MDKLFKWWLNNYRLNQKISKDGKKWEWIEKKEEEEKFWILKWNMNFQNGGLMKLDKKKF